MGIFDVFKSKPDVKEIGNLNCVNIGGKFDTGHKVDNKALFKYLKDHIKKKTLKKEYSTTIKDKTISDTINEVKVASAGSFFIPRNFINEKDYEKTMGFRIIDKSLIILNIKNDQEWWSTKIDYEEEIRSISMQMIDLDDEEYEFLKPLDFKLKKYTNPNLYDYWYDMWKGIYTGLFKTEKRKKFPINRYLSFTCFGE